MAKQCPKCFRFHDVGVRCPKGAAATPKAARTEAVKVVVGKLPKPDALTKQLTETFQGNVAIATGQPLELPAYNPNCPVCEARRLRQIEAQKRYRRKSK